MRYFRITGLASDEQFLIHGRYARNFNAHVSATDIDDAIAQAKRVFGDKLRIDSVVYVGPSLESKADELRGTK